jgi:hypothetical protein
MALARTQSPATSDASGGAKNGTAIQLDHRKLPFLVTVAAVVTGTATYTVQVSVDGTNYYTAGTADLTASALVPITAVANWVRIRQTAGNGSVACSVQQAG